MVKFKKSGFSALKSAQSCPPAFRDYHYLIPEYVSMVDAMVQAWVPIPFEAIFADTPRVDES